MAQKTPASTASMRALTYRISSTPPKQLAKIAPQIASNIWNCRDLLSTSTESKQYSDALVTVTRFKTQISTLLQDRSVEGRWSAVVLVKTAIEAGGLEVLGNCNQWVQKLLGILKKPDPATTRTLVVLILTRIFMLTWDYENLKREITTPALTSFVPTCISNIENMRCSASELEAVLEVFALLLPRHPTIFRTNESTLRTILAKIISSTSTDDASTLYYSEAHRTVANRLWVLLHNCAPKQGASEKWDQRLRDTVNAAHATCDRVFRPVLEDWQSVAGIQPSVPAHALSSGEVETESDDAAGLKPWKGTYAGGERLVSLLQLAKEHLKSATSGTVSVRVGLIVDLLTRVLRVIVPRSGKQQFVQYNNQISKDEREALFAVLPRIHVAASQVALTMLKRFSLEAASSLHTLIDQLLSVFSAERYDFELRLTLYQLFGGMLYLTGPTMTKQDIDELAPVLRACCKELLPLYEVSAASATKTNRTAPGINQQLGLAGTQASQTYPTDSPALRDAANSLLRTALLKVDAACISPPLRAQMDRVAVLTKDRNLIYASVLNPPTRPNDARGQASLMPILARLYGHTPDVEALLRPRMPVVQSGKRVVTPEEEDEVDSDAEDDDEEMDGAEERDFESTSGLLNHQAENPLPGQLDQLAPEGAEQMASKRRAEEDVEAKASAKRLRASPVVESLLPSDAQVLPGADLAISQTDVPTTVTVLTTRTESSEDPGLTLQQTSVLPQEVHRVGPTTSTADSDGDNSDFEMPPLTMEPDTDPEDEDEDDVLFG